MYDSYRGLGFVYMLDREIGNSWYVGYKVDNSSPLKINLK